MRTRGCGCILSCRSIIHFICHWRRWTTTCIISQDLLVEDILNVLSIEDLKFCFYVCMFALVIELYATPKGIQCNAMPLA